MFAERNLAFWGWAGLLVGSVAWAEIQPTQSLIGAVINVSVMYALASHPVTIEVGE